MPIPLDRRFRLLFMPLHTPERYYRNYSVVEKLDLSRLSIYAQLKEAVAFAKGDVLDLGCGIGYVTNFLQAKGLDKNPEAVAVARKKFPRTKYEVGSYQDLIRKGKRFKAIVCVNVVEHLEDDVRDDLLKKLPLLLKPGGRFVVVYDNMYHPLQLLSGLKHPGMLLTDPTHVHCWRPSVFRRLLEQRMEVLAVKPGNILSLFLPWTNRFASAHLYIMRPKAAVKKKARRAS